MKWTPTPMHSLFPEAVFHALWINDTEQSTVFVQNYAFEEVEGHVPDIWWLEDCNKRGYTKLGRITLDEAKAIALLYCINL